jgi:hypothetical protein
MDLSWSGSLGLTITTGLKHGPSIEELVWGDVRDWRDADGDAHLVRPLARLAPRPAHTIAKVKRELGRVVSIDQITPARGRCRREGLSYIVFDPEETGRWEGSSMLRPAWAAWRMKKALQIAAGIGWDRFASGLPVVFHPDNPDAEERAKKIGEQIRQHERAFVTSPRTGPAQSGRPDSEWFLELLNGAATLADPVPLLRWFTEQESRGRTRDVLAARLDRHRLARGRRGSDRPVLLGVQAIAKLVARERERQVIRRIVEVNFGASGRAYTPKLRSRGSRRDVIVVAQAISYLSNAGFTFTDAAQDDVREMLGFGKLSDVADTAGIHGRDAARRPARAGPRCGDARGDRQRPPAGDRRQGEPRTRRGPGPHPARAYSPGSAARSRLTARAERRDTGANTYAPNQDTDQYFSSATNELATAGGYTAGGQTLAGKTLTYDGPSNTVRFKATDVTWTAATFTARRAVIRKDTGVAGTSHLLTWIDFGADQSPAGIDFKISFDPTDGLARGVVS